MPLHDWTLAPSGIYHEFHQSWSVRIKDTLNAGRLPKGHYALVEQRIGKPEGDIIAVQSKPAPPKRGTATLAPPRTKLSARTLSEAARYAEKADRISIRHPFGQIVAVIEIVSPGNKDSKNALRSFVAKSVELIRAGVQLLIVDPFPPGRYDPHGLHAAIWDEIASDSFELPGDAPLTLVSYQVGDEIVAHIEPIAAGEAMPDMPLFLDDNLHVAVPLEETYRATWDAAPEPIRELILGVN